MGQTIYKVVGKTSEQEVYMSPGISGELVCIYMYNFATHPMRGTPGLMAFITIEDAREYREGNQLIFEAETSEILPIELPNRLPLPTTKEEAVTYWKNPYTPENGYETPRGTVLCRDITLRRRVK